MEQSQCRRRLWLALAAAVAASCMGDMSFVSGFREARPQLLKRDVSMGWRLTKKYRDKKRERSEWMVDVIMPTKAKGFRPKGERALTRERFAFAPSQGLAALRFDLMEKDGSPCTEVFVRIPGQMPWKRLGEVADRRGDFERAVTANWDVMQKHAFWLYKKVHRHLASPHPIQFGFADTEKNIVPATRGPLPLGTSPKVLRSMAHVNGFRAWEGRELRYRGEQYRKMQDPKYYSPGNYHRDPNKKWKLDMHLHDGRSKAGKWFYRRWWNEAHDPGSFSYLKRSVSPKANLWLGLGRYR
mmetsp:Transcript_47071/g.84817  ORF Transcript_47071/g.84817 Transcript_47071/m.84817 type:complete len:298 (+) Transcript_47071:52-945(+)